MTSKKIILTITAFLAVAIGIISSTTSAEAAENPFDEINQKLDQIINIVTGIDDKIDDVSGSDGLTQVQQFVLSAGTKTCNSDHDYLLHVFNPDSSSRVSGILLDGGESLTTGNSANSPIIITVGSGQNLLATIQTAENAVADCS